MRSDARVGGGGARVGDHRVVPLDRVIDDVRPQACWGVRFGANGRGELGDEADGPLGDRVQVVVVRRARRVVQADVASVLLKVLGHEAALAVGVDCAHVGPRQRVALGVHGRSDEGGELGHDPLVGVNRLGLELDECDEHVARVLVDGEDDVAVPAD